MRLADIEMIECRGISGLKGFRLPYLSGVLVNGQDWLGCHV